MVVDFTRAATQHALDVMHSNPIALTDQMIALLAATGIETEARTARGRAQLAVIAVQVQAAELIDNLTIERR
jgi:hypothetical protein